MTALHTQVVSKLATRLERAIRVAPIILHLVLVSSVTALHTEVVSKLAASLECAVWVALSMLVYSTCPHWMITTHSLAGAACGGVVSRMAALGAELLGQLRALGECAVGVAVWGV